MSPQDYELLTRAYEALEIAQEATGLTLFEMAVARDDYANTPENLDELLFDLSKRITHEARTAGAEGSGEPGAPDELVGCCDGCSGYFANNGDPTDIHRCDECDRFEDDYAATLHVVGKALSLTLVENHHQYRGAMLLLPGSEAWHDRRREEGRRG